MSGQNENSTSYVQNNEQRARPSEDFIPFGQSTPHRGGGGGGGGGSFRRTPRGNTRYRGHSTAAPPYRDCYRGNTSPRAPYRDSADISAYLHPSMLQDPWLHLRRNPPAPAHTNQPC